jgi:hypothetical protein
MSSICSSQDTSRLHAIQYYVTLVVDPCGVIFNFVCIVCFAQILWHKSESNQVKSSNLFKYLIIKAICDFSALILDTFSVLDLGNFAYFASLLSYSIYYVYFFNDIQQILLMLSALMEVIAHLGILIS